MAHVALLSRCSSNPSTKTASCVGRGGTACRSPVSDTCSLSPQHGTRLFGLRGRCITASVKNLAQRSSIHSIMRADGDDPGPWFAAIPCIPDGDIHALADDLKDDPSVRCFGGMDHAFAAVDAGRELARRFPQRFQGKRLFRLVAPRPEDLRVVVPMAMHVLPTSGIVTVRRMSGLVMWRCAIESGGIKPADRQQDLQRHIAARMPRRADSGGTGRRARP